MNQPSFHMEEAPELKRPDMPSFTASDGVDPGGCDVALNLRQGGPDQQIEEMGRPIDGLVRQPGGQPSPNLLSQALVPPSAINV